jgi:hypothetical protein
LVLEFGHFRISWQSTGLRPGMPSGPCLFGSRAELALAPGRPVNPRPWVTVDAYILKSPEKSGSPATLLRAEFPLQENSEPDLATLVLKTPARRLKHIQHMLIYIFDLPKSIFVDFAQHGQIRGKIDRIL